MQMKSQEETTKIIQKIGGATTEGRAKIKTDVPAITAKDAVSLFFEIQKFEDAMTDMQIGPSDNALRWRALKGKAEGAADGIIEELLSDEALRERLKNDTNEDYGFILNLVWETTKERMGLTQSIEQRLAKKVWEDP